ncbi:MAG TPA: hypothetical protein DFS52_09450, partial [Myxococcales bacterium]|nr:hypothetical protein [Myxococcales bacterium]
MPSPPAGSGCRPRTRGSAGRRRAAPRPRRPASRAAAGWSPASRRSGRAAGARSSRGRLGDRPWRARR